MSVRQWWRIVEVTVSGKAGTLTVRDLKIDFEVSKGIGSKQNTATISIWNLTASHRKQLGEEFDKIELKVGYKAGPLSTIFKGNIRDVTHTKETADVKSAMECGDGDEAFSKGAVSKTFPSGTKPKEIVDYLAGEMPGATKGEMKGIDDLPAYKRPVTLFGWSWSEMDKIGREHGFYWSIQNGQVEAVKNDQVLQGTTVLSSETGMLSIPEITDKGVKIKALLNADIAPGRQIDVRSDFLDEDSGRDKRKTDQGGGIFRVSDVTFSGSTRSEEYYVEAEASRVEGGKVVK
ncbi:phage protein [Bosea sp. UC22_33]|uniref:phage protein n=1 Tax=Bosea sp. UC22_33 TaxID=3350165 RepID=UPI0036701352